MLPYRYHSLQHDDSIRILALHRSSNYLDPLTCTIQHVRLSDASLKYEAVSYVWGDTTEQESIYLHNGRRELRVGRSCSKVLRDLRRKDYDRLVWIDAICIDQENLVERAEQVCIMTDIYESAFEVLVYLGEETTGSRILFEELAEATEALLQGKSLDQRPLPSANVIQALDDLLQRPWFKRVWVLQEVCMKDSIAFICGADSASGKALRECAYGYQNSRITKDILPLVLRLTAEYPTELSTLQATLWNMLYRSRTCLATDPRDKIFALKSLLGSRQLELDFLINYTRSVEETFIGTALFLLPVLGLRILTAVRHPHNFDMPSWIPDWSQHFPLNADFCDLQLPSWDYKPFDEERCTIYLPPQAERNCLELHVTGGSRYARIVYRSRAFLFDNLYEAEEQLKWLYHGLENLRKLFRLEGMSNDPTVRDHLGKEIFEVMTLIDGDPLHKFLLQFWGPRIDDGYPFTDFLEQEISGAFFESLQQCRIILLDNNQLGIVAESAQIEDVVCIFPGAHSPCVLRQSMDGHWMLVDGAFFVFTFDYRSEENFDFLCDDYLKDNQDRVEDFRVR